jgi:hypothetical protein
LDAVPPQQQSYIKSLFGAAKSAIDFGVVALTTNKRIRFWKAWTNFIATYFPTYDKKLSTLSQPEQIDVLVSFARHVRSGGVSRRKQHVCARTVQVLLRALTSYFELDGEQSPVVPPQGNIIRKSPNFLKGTNELSEKL